MQTIMKRTISFLMAMVLCVSMVPVPARADSGETVAETAPVELSLEETTPAEPAQPEAPAETEQETVPPETLTTPVEETVLQETTEPVPQEPMEPVPEETAETTAATEETIPSGELSIKTLPQKLMYQVGDGLDLTGLVLSLEDDQGTTWEIGVDDGITLVSYDTSKTGAAQVVVGYGEQTVQFEIYVHTVGVQGEFLQDSSGYPESAHNYGNRIDESYVYSCAGAQYLKLTFTQNTYTESGCDYIWLYDGNNTQIGKYSGSSLKGQTVQVQGDTVKIRLTSDYSVTGYGFSLDSIYAYINSVEHEPSNSGVYTQPKCFEDGYTTHSCWICGTVYVVQDTGSAKHSFADGTCSICGLPENQISGGTISENVAWAITEDNTLYIAGTGAIPDNYDWGGKLSSVSAIVVGEGITQIGSRCFYNCTSVKRVTIPGSVKSIGAEAFYYCTGLNQIDIADGVTSIGNKAFANCTALRHLYIPASVTTIAASGYSYSPFYYCNSELVLNCAADAKQNGWDTYWNYRSSSTPLSVNYGVSREEYAFWLNLDKTAESIVIPEGIVNIPAKAFYNCTSLKSVTLPSTVTAIGDYAFYECRALESVELPVGLKSIGSYAFYGCDKLTTVDIPGSVTAIGSQAFAYCNGLTELKLSEGLVTLGDRVLQGTKGVKTITLPSTLATMGYSSGYSAFSGSSVTSVTLAEGTAVIGDYAFYGATSVTSITIPESVASIGSRAFYNCSGLTAIEIPDGVTAIPEYAFYGCTKLAEVELSENLTSIGQYAFYSCRALESVAIPSQVTTIYSHTFDDCRALKTAVLADGVTVIGEYAFANCGALETVTLSANLKEIGRYAFQNCEALSSITLPEGLTTLGYSVFYGCGNLTELRLPGTIQNMQRTSTRGPLDGSGVTKVIFGDGFTEIPAYALSVYASSGTYASKVTEVVFEDGSKIQRIGSYAFNNCRALQTVQIPEQVTELNSYVFQNCTALTTVTLPQNLRTIGDYAFYSCTALTQADMPDTVTSVGYYAFYNCTSLKNITVAPGQNVGRYAYSGCSGAEKLIIGDNAVIGNYAFENCSGLTSIVIGNDVSFGSNVFRGVVLSGSCGTGVTWSLSIDSGLLTIAGSGTMDDFSPENPSPWSGFATSITALEIADTVENIGAYAFAGCSNLEYVNLTEKIQTIGANSFADCDSLTYVEIPDGVDRIGTGAFDSCAALDQVVFLGDAPVLEDNCFGNEQVDVRYPETASGFIKRIFDKFTQYVWTMWDDTVPTKDVVILLDTSGSMSGKTDTLTNASTQLLRSIGGAMKKTNISVVDYDSSARMLCDFTSNTYRLVKSVSSLDASGGTQYRNALLKANDLLVNSSADIKFVIMFSDGEPGDNKNNIYALAEQMRQQGIVIYTVGLLSSSSQRQVLINVAGSETRYFEATNIAGLIAAFEELSENFGKSEYTTAEIKVNDVRRDLFNESYTLCLSSDQIVSFYLTPGTNDMYDNVAKIALEQNGKYVLMNESGVFESIVPGDYFQGTETVYVVMLDAAGNVIERKELLLKFADSFKVTYDLGAEMGNKVHAEAEYVPGNDLEKPKDPTRHGFTFEGWYGTEACQGIDFFNDLNYYNRIELEGDLTLYAKWEPKATQFIMKKDSWLFTNSPTFFGQDTHYEMKAGDILALFAGHDILTKTKLAIKQMGEWGGSCFGMSSAAILMEAGNFDIYNFPGESDNRFNTVYEADMKLNKWGDFDVGNIESMINFYHLRQYLSRINTPLWDFSDTNESANMADIINTMLEEDGPVLLNLRLYNTAANLSGYHSVVAYDLQETGTGYDFQVYDCSLSGDISYTVQVTIDNGTYTVDHGTWETMWGYNGYPNMVLGAVLTPRQLKYYPLLKVALPFSTSNTASSYDMTTSYGSFTISNGTSSAVISNGQLVSGDLNIACNGQVNNINAPVEYSFTLPVLAQGQTYSITQTSGGATKTMVWYDHSTNGFLANLEAAAGGTITISADGTVQTQYNSAVAQNLTTTRNDMTTPWYMVEIQGTSNGFTVNPTAEDVTVVSAGETAVDIQVRSDFNNVTLNDVPVGTDAAQIKENETRDCVVVVNNEVIASQSFGYSVAFDSQMGTSVETLTNVPYGSLVTEPTDPTKAGCIFEGWFIDEELTKLWDFANDTVTADIVLYAGWSIDPNYLQSVTFRVPGREDQIVYVTKGDRIPVDYAPLGDKGEVMEWYRRADYNSKAWNFETDTVSESMVLYGKTTLRTVNFVTNNSQSLAPVDVYSGLTVRKPVGLEKSSYTLCGWYTDAAFTDEWDFDNDKVTEDMTLYARWLENVIDKNGKDTGICIEIVNENSYVYTGKAIKPEIRVWDDGNVLTLGTDYTVSYKNNTNARSKDDITVKESKLPQVVVQGKGNYKASKKLVQYFTIHQADLKDLQVTLPEYVAAKSGDKLQSLKVTVNTELIKVSTSNYTISYYTDEAMTQQVKGITAAGKYYIVLEAKQKDGVYTGNFKGKTDPIEIDVVPKEKLLTSAKITVPKTVTAVFEQPDEANAIRSLISKLVINKVTYLTDEANIDQFMQLFEVTAVDTDGTKVSQSELGKILMTVGKKTITVSAKKDNAEGYVDQQSVSVTVKGVSLSKKQFTVTFGEPGAKVNLKTEYNATAQTPDIFTQLEEGRDYTVTYLNGKTAVSAYQIKNAGSYKLEITGKGVYTGKLTYSFTIAPTDLAKAYSAGQIKITSPGKATYSPSGAKLGLSVTYVNNRARVALSEGIHYTLKYSGNKKVTDSAAATISGKGNFKGSLNKALAPELIFAVEKKPLSSNDITVSVTGVSFKKGVISSVKYTVYDGGKSVSSSQHTSSLTDNGKTVTLRVTAKEMDYTGFRDVVIKKDLIKTSDSKQVKIALPKDTKFYYTGSQIKPTVTITDQNGRDISDCFTITYGKNVTVGAGSVTITGKPDMGYYGEKTVRFTILPKWAMWLFG